MSKAPSVVAIGGGHGTAVTLRAARCYSHDLTAIVSVADDGGSSGRLRDLLGVPALGDLRKCLIAVADDSSALARAMDHRYDQGELAGHALGNLILAGLIEATGDLVSAVAEAAHLVGAIGTILPATDEEVELIGVDPSGTTVGQVAIMASSTISTVSVRPQTAKPPPAALHAIERADQIVIGPGSLYTSVLAAAAVPDITHALRLTSAQKVYVCNLQAQEPETRDYSVADHLSALARHGVDVDVALIDSSRGMPLGAPMVSVVDSALAGSNGLVHDPARLAQALQELAWSAPPSTREIQ